MAEVGKHMEDVCSKEEMVRVYSVDRAGGILKPDFKIPDDAPTYEDRVMTFAKRIENFINSGEDK